MRILTIEEARKNFDGVISNVKEEPVTFTKNGEKLGVLIAPEDYEGLRQFYANRASEIFRKTAESIGMTQEEALKLIESDD